MRTRQPLVPKSVARADDRRRRRAPTPPVGLRPRQTDRRRWHMVKAAVGLVLLLAIALAAGVGAVRTLAEVLRTGDRVVEDYADGDAGTEVRSEAGRFTVVFPAEPESTAVAVPGSEQSADALDSEVADVDITISWFDLPSAPADPLPVLDVLASALATDRQADIGDRGRAIGDPPRHDFVLDSGDGRTEYVRHVLVGQRVYQLEVDADRGDDVLSPTFARFVESFRPDPAAG